MLVPEDPPICECRYDETRDEMDRDDCPFHCDLPGNDERLICEVESHPSSTEETRPVKRKQVADAQRKREVA
jgi:hypothetical protein